MLRSEAPTTVLAAFGMRQMTTLKAEAVAHSSSAIKFIRKVSPKGLDMFISIERTTYNGAATIGLGLKGMENRKIVDNS